MAHYYNVVPWFNSDEWLSIHEKLCSPSLIHKQEALDLMLVWKARCPSLPSGIESTLNLLEVHLEDLKDTSGNLSDQLIRLAYSSAIMRFVNHMLDSQTIKGTSLYQAAKKLAVPHWIIDLRHDTAHSNSLPNIELLREAAVISFDWLKNNYWDKHKEYISDYITGIQEEEDIVDTKIECVLNFCLSLSICAHSQCKIKTLADVPDENMRESIMNDVQEFFGDKFNLTKPNSVSVSSLIITLNQHSKQLLKCQNLSKQVKKVLLGEDSLLLSLELVDVLGENNFKNKNSLGRHFLQCFEVLLIFLQQNELLLDFILDLINISQNDELCEDKRHLAALWVTEILKALSRTELFINKMSKTASNKKQKSKKELKSLFHHMFPKGKPGLILDLEKCVPKELNNIHFIQPIITSYNPYLYCFIKELLKLVKPELPKETVSRIFNLSELISNPDKFNETSSQIFTAQDLNKAGKESSDEVIDCDSDCVEICDDLAPVNIKSKCGTSDDSWKLASQEYDWSSCPIGVLPWQKINYEQMEVE